MRSLREWWRWWHAAARQHGRCGCRCRIRRPRMACAGDCSGAAADKPADGSKGRGLARRRFATEQEGGVGLGGGAGRLSGGGWRLQRRLRTKLLDRWTARGQLLRRVRHHCCVSSSLAIATAHLGIEAVIGSGLLRFHQHPSQIAVPFRSHVSSRLPLLPAGPLQERR